MTSNFFDWLFEWFIDRWIDFIYWLIGFIGWVTDWLTEWLLIDWRIGWFSKPLHSLVSNIYRGGTSTFTPSHLCNFCHRRIVADECHTSLCGFSLKLNLHVQGKEFVHIDWSLYHHVIMSLDHSHACFHNFTCFFCNHAFTLKIGQKRPIPSS